jgi:PPK2 family polyphosphate:nucleotide phosphotransferase
MAKPIPLRKLTKLKDDDVRKRLRAHVVDGHMNLEESDPDATPLVNKKRAMKAAISDEDRLMNLQDQLHAEAKRSILIVLQGMDTSGKDGTIRHALRGLNPQGTRIVPFKAPSEVEKRHPFLWRIRRNVPTSGEVVIFNRSHYEDVLVPKVHKLLPDAAIEQRYAEINAFEKGLTGSGTVIVKFYLHISFEEQRRRLVERLVDAEKNWKFSEGDIKERAFWDDYRTAFDNAIAACSTDIAPWYIIPANKKWYRNWAVSEIIARTLEDMNLQYPRPKLNVPDLMKRLQPVP